MSRHYVAKRMAAEQGIPYVMALRLVRERAAEIEAAAREALPAERPDLAPSIFATAAAELLDRHPAMVVDNARLLDQITSPRVGQEVFCVAEGTTYVYDPATLRRKSPWRRTAE